MGGECKAATSDFQFVLILATPVDNSDFVLREVFPQIKKDILHDHHHVARMPLNICKC